MEEFRLRHLPAGGQNRRGGEPRRAPRRSALAYCFAILKGRSLISCHSVVLSVLLKWRRHNRGQPHRRWHAGIAPPPFSHGRFPLARHPCRSRVVAAASMPLLCSYFSGKRRAGKRSGLRRQGPKIRPAYAAVGQRSRDQHRTRRVQTLLNVAGTKKASNVTVCTRASKTLRRSFVAAAFPCVFPS